MKKAFEKGVESRLWERGPLAGDIDCTRYVGVVSLRSETLVGVVERILVSGAGVNAEMLDVLSLGVNLGRFLY